MQVKTNVKAGGFMLNRCETILFDNRLFEPPVNKEVPPAVE